MLVVSRPNCLLEHDASCRFQIAWKINPYMQIGAAIQVRAIEQHTAFVTTLRSLGARVLQLPFIHGAFDSVFIRDSALLRRDDRGLELLPAAPRFAQRATEPRCARDGAPSRGLRRQRRRLGAFLIGKVCGSTGSSA